jgi:hypothetical protein
VKPPYTQGLGPGNVSDGSPVVELLVFPPPGAPDTIVLRWLTLNIRAAPPDNVALVVTPTPDPTIEPFTLAHLEGQTQDADASIQIRYVMNAGSHLFVTYNGAGPGLAAAEVVYYRLSPA